MEQTIGKNVVAVVGQVQNQHIVIPIQPQKQQLVQQQEHNRGNVKPVER